METGGVLVILFCHWGLDPVVLSMEQKLPLCHRQEEAYSTGCQFMDFYGAFIVHNCRPLSVSCTNAIRGQILKWTQLQARDAHEINEMVSALVWAWTTWSRELYIYMVLFCICNTRRRLQRDADMRGLALQPAFETRHCYVMLLGRLSVKVTGQ